MKIPRLTPILAASTVAGAAAGAQQPAQPPIRQLGPVVATAHETFGQLAGVRQLPGGRLLVNDVTGRRVLLLDSTLAVSSVVADSTGATGNAYSGRMAGIIPYHGDSTLFVDPQSLSMLVIDPGGKIGRTMSVPRSDDAMSLAGFQGTPGFDAQGRLVYRGFARPAMPPRGANGAPMGPPDFPDSAAILRIDLATRKVDTVAFIKTPKITFQTTQTANGGINISSLVNPLPLVDDWAVTTDGSVAVVRGRDYHVDWVNADGSRSSSPKMPFDWQRLSDDDKVAFIDSVKAARERLLAQQQPAQQTAASGPAAGGTASGGANGGSERARPTPEGGGGMVMTFGGPGGGGAPPRGGDGPGTVRMTVGMGGGGPTPAGLNFVSPSELPDYKPPFFSNSMRADLDGNLWIRTIPTRAIPGGPIYDVVNRKGELIDRVQLPPNRTIIGFGAGGTVYLAQRDPAVPVTPTNPPKTVLERARLK